MHMCSINGGNGSESLSLSPLLLPASFPPSLLPSLGVKIVKSIELNGVSMEAIEYTS